MKRGEDPGQLDMFADQPATTTPITANAPVVSGFGGPADLVPRVLADIHDGCYAVLVQTGRVVRLDGDGRCRHADDDFTAVVESLITQRYAKLGEVTTARHGAVSKVAERVVLCTSGHKIRARWFHLAGAR